MNYQVFKALGARKDWHLTAVPGGSGMPRNTNYTFVLQSAFDRDKPIKDK